VISSGPTWTALAILGLASACSPDPHALSWTVAFEDVALEARAAVFEGTITVGDCTMTRGAVPVYQAEFEPSGMPPSPGVLAPGTYAFSARARDYDCAWFAAGCTTETLPRLDVDETLVVLFGVPEEAACPAGCASGRCTTPDASIPDVGIDAPDAMPLDTGSPDTGPMDTGPPDTGPPDTGPADTGSPDTFVPECASDGDCGPITWARTSGWSCRADGALDRANFAFTIPVCTSGRCGSRSETQSLECRCRNEICSSAGCDDVVDSSTRCDVGGVEGECPNPAVEGECHR